MPSSQEGLARLVARGAVSDRVVAAFRSVRREDFVPRASRSVAYTDRPVGLPRSQTTSQPSLIAMMIEAAAVGPEDRVLEIGAGYGFQTALLAQLAAEVVAVERHEELGAEAAANLRRVGIENAVVHVGDGWHGWPESAPYAAIVVSAAADEVPEALGDQLVEGGRLVIPVRSGGSDDVWLLGKEEGALRRIRLVSPARFVPLVRETPSGG